LAKPLPELAQFDEAGPGVVLAGAEGTNGEWARFERTIHSSLDTADTGLEDERCGVDLTMEQDHPEQEENIDVVAGERRVAFLGEMWTVTEGEEGTVPPGDPH
jgi:hypothetical protein